MEPGSCRGWKASFHYKLVIFRVYVNLPEGTMFFLRIYAVSIYKCMHACGNGKQNTHINIQLLGGFNPSEKYEFQLGVLFPTYGKS